MKAERRQTYLKIGAAAVACLFLLDRLVLSPALAHWGEQGDRIAVLRQKVERGRQLLEREDSIRERWADMQRNNLPPDMSVAENQVFKAIERWARDSEVVFTSLTPQWQTHDEGYETLECRAAGTGNQASIGRFIYEMETDHVPVNLEECELSTRDNRGAQIALTAKFSFLRLPAPERSAR